MDYSDKWRQEVATTLTDAANLTTTVQDVELEYALMSTGVLWPLRQPVQEFDMEAIQAVNKLLGSQAKHVLRLIQGWFDDDMMAVAQTLKAQLAQNTELSEGLTVLNTEFDAFTAFANTLSSQPATTEATQPPVEEAQVKTASPQPVGVIPPTDVAPRVFVSYARSDGEHLAQDLRQRLEAEGISVWQDRIRMQGGRDWWLQITEALNEVEFMVLIATPSALKSEIVRKEWRYARQQGVCVYPVQGTSNLQFEDIPRWMRNVHFYNLDLEWPKLVEDLNNPCETPRVPFMAEELPDDFVPRTELLSRISAAVVDNNNDPIATALALQGTGGYGKTTLCKALCHDEDIRQAFDDGVLWITLGENPGDLTGRVIDLIEVLTGERPGFAGLDAAEARLVQLLADRDILMILDDAWNVAHLNPFLRGGTRCARIITTRNSNALPSATTSIEIGAMERNEAVALLSQGLDAEKPQEYQNLANRLGNWPLLLKLTNGAVRDRVHNNRQPLAAALAYVNKALDKRGLTAFDAHNAAARDQAVSQTLGVSQELLSDDERNRFAELAIFPGDVNIPLAVLEKLWNATAVFDDFDTEELCSRLQQLSLLAHFDPNVHYITLDKILCRYLAQEQGDEKLAALNQQFLDAYATNLPSDELGYPQWCNLPQTNTYLWTHLAHHLIRAGRTAELAATVKDLNYLVIKTTLRSPNAVEADMLAARQTQPNDAVLLQLHQAFSQSSHLLGECTSVQETANTLHSRIAHTPALSNLVAAGQVNLPKPLLTAFHRLPDLPDSSLIRTIGGHSQAILACDACSDGSTIVSMDRSTTLKVWDAKTGAERHTLSGHEVMGNSCAISADGTTIVSASWDGEMKVWDAQTGTDRFSITAHITPIFTVATNADGSIIVSGSKDKTIKVWDGHSGAERFTLSGHERSVTGVAITGNGTTIVSTSPDGMVNIWNTADGTLRSSIKAYELEAHNAVANLTFTAASSAMLNCAVSADGHTIVTAMPDSTLKIWDAQTGQERFTLKGHTGWIEDCKISADGSLVVSASNDKTVKVWDAATGNLCFTLEGHLRAVTGCAISDGGKTIVSSSQDKTVKLWDAEAGATQSVDDTYTFNSQCCAAGADAQTLIFDSPGNMLRVVDAQSGVEQFAIKGHMRPITGCDLSLDGQTAITSSQDRTLKIWNTATGTETQTLSGHLWAVSNCALSADGSTAISASDDSTLKVWDVATGTERFNLIGHVRDVKDCAISPDNSYFVSASSDKTLKVWDAANGQQRLSLEGHDSSVNACTVSPNSLLIASACNDDTLKLWNSKTGDMLHTLHGHKKSVQQCAFSPNGEYLLSVSKDKTINLWDVQQGLCIATLRVESPLTGCTWYPDGEHFVAVGQRGVYFLRAIW